MFFFPMVDFWPRVMIFCGIWLLKGSHLDGWMFFQQKEKEQPSRGVELCLTTDQL